MKRLFDFFCNRGSALRGAVTATMLSLGLAIIANVGGVAPAAAQQFTVPFEANQYILDQTNLYRQQNGLPKLTMFHPANKAADDYAQFLAQNKASGHEADGRTPTDRVNAAGGKGKFCAIAENVHGSWASPMKSWEQASARAMEAWKNSSGHAANMRSGNNKMGIGVHGWKHGDMWHYRFVQVFVLTNC